MEDLKKLLEEKKDELARYYQESSYSPAGCNDDDKNTPHRYLRKELINDLQFGEISSKNIRYEGIWIKSNFRLLGLVRAYDLDKRCNVSEQSTVSALYETLKKEVREKNLPRLENDYSDFISSQKTGFLHWLRRIC